ncbi:MAG: hypothetical protein CMP22_07125 [Rickettsiales bacterium]|nr:hypothetical protein [Rickettsiales bacterium]
MDSAKEIYGAVALQKLCRLVAMDTRIKPAAKRVFLTMLSYANIKTLSCYPVQQTIGDDYGISRQAVGQAIKQLVRNGYIIKKTSISKTGTDNTYYFNIYLVQVCGLWNYKVKAPELATVCNLKDFTGWKLPSVSGGASSKGFTKNKSYNKKNKTDLLKDKNVLLGKEEKVDVSVPKDQNSDKYYSMWGG